MPFKRAAVLASPTIVVVLLLLPLLLSFPPPAVALPTDSSAPQSNTGQQVLAPVLVAVGASLALACLAMVFRGRLTSWFKRHVPGTSTVAGDGQGAAGAGGATAQASTPTPGIVSGVSEGDRPAGERRRRRRRRSRDSVVGLPLYSEDPTEEEMTLFKHRPSDVDSRDVREDLLYGSGGEAGDSTSSLVRPSIDASSSDTHRGSIDIASASTSLHRLSTPPSYANDSSLGPDDSSEIIHLNVLDPPNPSLDRPTHRSTNSLPTATSASLSIPMPTPGRNRASTFRSIFARNGSSSSLAPVDAGRSPYGQGSGGSPSSTRGRSASSASISSLSISLPLQHTLVSSSFVFPRAGLTPQQVSFISSRESLGAFGYGAGAEAPPAFDEASSRSHTPTPSIHLSSPTRGRRSSSVSTQLSNPLGVGSNRTPPASPVATLHSPPLEPSSPPREAPPLPSDLSSAAAFTASALPTLPPIDTSSSPLPAIFMLSATPTQSSAPSPIIPQADDDAEDGAPPPALHFQRASRAANFSTISEASFTSQATFTSAASPLESDAASFSTARGDGSV